MLATTERDGITEWWTDNDDQHVEISIMGLGWVSRSCTKPPLTPKRRVDSTICECNRHIEVVVHPDPFSIGRLATRVRLGFTHIATELPNNASDRPNMCAIGMSMSECTPNPIFRAFGGNGVFLFKCL